MSACPSLAVALEPEVPRPAARAIAADCILFTDGLYGFPECRSFVLLPTGRTGLFRLQSTEHEALCLLLADPFQFFRGYVVDLPDLDVARLEATAPADVALLVTVTLPDSPGRASTANLQAPIAINLEKKFGRQVILDLPAWDVREPMDLSPSN
jgi:flagellar assembly factor FliW